MPSVAAALLALALHGRPPTDAGVWLDAAPAPGVVAGEAQAPEGVLHVDLYVLRGATATKVDTYVPSLPFGTIRFALRWDRAGAAPGRVTLRVVATTLVRGLSAEAADTVAAPRADPAAHRVDAAPAPPDRAVRPLARTARARGAAPVRVVLDDSGRAFGAVAPVLPYGTAAVPAPPTAPTANPAADPAALDRPAPPAGPGRDGAASVAAGLLLLLACSHLHRALRTQPDPRDTA